MNVDIVGIVSGIVCNVLVGSGLRLIFAVG